jgi:putative ABC transport system ATP-binding protein
MDVLQSKGHGAGPILEARDLGREVDGVRVVNSISLEVYCGQVWAIFGPSGSGKSSFLRLLNRLDEPTEGTVFLHSEDYRKIPPRELRRKVGMVMQSPNLFPGNVAENLRFGPQQHGEKISEEDIHALLERVGLGGYGHRDVSRLSGGEAQRVSLARTLANSPEILLLDEPTSALDESSEREIEELLSGIVKENGLTCLIVTHDKSQASRIASHAVRMDKGRLVKKGSIKEVLDA